MALFVTHAATAGGAEVVLEHFLRMRPGEHRVLVLSRGECAERFAQTGAQVTVAPVLDPGRPVRTAPPREAVAAGIGAVAALPRILRAAAAGGERVIVTNSMKAHVLAPALARLPGRRVGLRLHDMLIPGELSATMRPLLLAAGVAAESTAAVSAACAAAARSYGLRRVRRFPNGVPAGEPPRPSPGSDVLLVAITQLARWKGVHHVLEALAAARAAGVRATLQVVGDAVHGDTTYRDQLQVRAARDDLAGAVTWHGRQADPTPFLRAADICIHLPDRPDPLPTALIEAQAWSLPVIARDCGGIAEIVEHQHTGIVLSGPADPAFAGAAIARLSDPGLRAQMAAAAHARALRLFSLDGYADRFDDWIASLDG
jgi:glycosyltransferase involved in cell wall biosynthesis